MMRETPNAVKSFFLMPAHEELDGDHRFTTNAVTMPTTSTAAISVAVMTRPGHQILMSFSTPQPNMTGMARKGNVNSAAAVREQPHTADDGGPSATCRG